MSSAVEGAVGRLSMKDEVAALKRRHTIAAAVDLFYDNGYENTTLDAVAEKLGVSKPFIYANFGSKSELLAEICERGVAIAHEAIDGVTALDLPPAQALELFARRYVATILENQKHIAVYVREDKNLEPGEARRIGVMRREFFAKIRALLEAGVATGDFAIDDSQIAALAIGGAVTWSTFWYRPDGRLTLDEISERMTRPILRLAGVSQGR